MSDFANTKSQDHYQLSVKNVSYLVQNYINVCVIEDAIFNNFKEQPVLVVIFYDENHRKKRFVCSYAIIQELI